MALPAIIGGVIAGAGMAWSAWEARKNRKFQERMSNTAHQREVEDLRKAGLNPALSARGGGSSTPSGDRAEIDASKAISSALQVQRFKAETELLRRQADQATASAVLSTTQAEDIHTTQAGRVTETQQRGRVAGLSADEAQARLPSALERARAEINQMSSAAEASRARARLDSLDEVRAMNEAEFEAALQTASPALRTLLLIIRSLPVRPR